MTNPSSPLSDDELRELDNYLLFEDDSDESMTLDILDGYLHAIASGPINLHPEQWIPGIWGAGAARKRPVESIEKLNHILTLIMRLLNSINAALENPPREIYPLWSAREYRGKEYDGAEGWANGFCYGVKLCQSEWSSLLETPQGQAWYRPIALLGEDDFVADQDALTKTPAMRRKLALQIPEAVTAMYEHWHP